MVKSKLKEWLTKGIWDRVFSWEEEFKIGVCVCMSVSWDSSFLQELTHTAVLVSHPGPQSAPP